MVVAVAAFHLAGGAAAAAAAAAATAARPEGAPAATAVCPAPRAAETDSCNKTVNPLCLSILSTT